MTLPPSMRLVSVTRLKAELSSLLDEVERFGTVIVITKRGREVARLTPVDRSVPSALGWMRGTVEFVGNPTAPEDVWDLDSGLLPK